MRPTVAVQEARLRLYQSCRALEKEGLSRAQIAERLGIPRRRVSTLLERPSAPEPNRTALTGRTE